MDMTPRPVAGSPPPASPRPAESTDTADAAVPPRPGILPLAVENVTFQAKGRPLIDDVSFRLEAGLRTVILGPNGAGKSLLLRLCHGLIAPSAGRIRWLGADAGRARRRQAMVFQRPVLLRRSVAANVAFGLKLAGVRRSERRRVTADVLARTGLARFADGPARLLSGGEQQKLALARAWALAPEVLFLDEPTASLDPAATHAVEAICAEMRAEGTRLVMVTHDVGQARRMADEVLFVHKGRLMEQTPAGRFFEHPDSGEAAAFLRGELRW